MTVARWLATPVLDDGFPLPVDRPFTTAQAAQDGVSLRHLKRLVDTGLLRRPLRGTYVAAQVPDSSALRARVAALLVPPGSVMVDWTALWFWTGIDQPNGDLDIPRLSVFRRSGNGRLRNPMTVSGERALTPDDLVEVNDGLFVTTPLRTAWDAGRFLPPLHALGAMDALVRHRGVSHAQMAAGLDRFKGQRGVVRLRMLVPLVDGASESMPESALRWRWHEVPGIPPPQTQIPVLGAAGRERYRIDVGLEELRYGAEYFGELWHGEQQRPYDESRLADLREHFGWVMDVFTKEDVYGTHETATQRLTRGILDARRRLGQPRRLAVAD